MINRSELIAITAAAALSCTLLAGCGSSASSDSSRAASSEAPSSSTSSQAASSEAPSSSTLASVSSILPDDNTNSSTTELDDVVNTLLESNPISNQFEITAMSIEYDFGLKAEDVISYKGVKSNDNGDAGLVLVIQPAEGKAQSVTDALKTCQEDQIAFYGNYSEFAQAQSNVENAVISGNDDLVVMVIASNECSADLTKAVDSVINK